MSVAARTMVSPATLSGAFRHEVLTVDETLPVFQLFPLTEELYLRNWPIRVFGFLFSGLGALALSMAAIGLYAVIAHMVSQRTQEIGIRIAMGASRVDILGLVLKQGMIQIAVGLGLGATGAYALSRLLRALLSPELQPDAKMFLLVAVVLLGAGVLACGIPARRATQVDPVQALRCE